MAERPGQQGGVPSKDHWSQISLGAIVPAIITVAAPHNNKRYQRSLAVTANVGN